MLRREGFEVNHKRVFRLYQLEGLKLRRKKRKRVSRTRLPLMTPSAPNERWSLDFTSDQLADGRRFRTLNIVDENTRECLAIEAGTSMPGSAVARVLEQVRKSAAIRKASFRTMAPNSSVARSTHGPIKTGSARTSFNQASPLKTHSSRASTASFGTNASTNIGLC